VADDGETVTAEVTHEALFEHWQQMKVWLDGSRSDLRFQRRLDEAAMIWQENGRPEGSLWRSPDLDLLQQYYAQSGADMTKLQHEFLIASKRSAKFKKHREKVSYFIFGVLGTLCLFLTKNITDIYDIEYITTKIQNQHTFFIGHNQSDYVYDLLGLVLRKAYPGKEVKIKKRKIIDDNQAKKTDALDRSEKDIKNKENRIKIDIDSMMQNHDRNQLAFKVDFPIDLGLLSHRLCLVHKNNRNLNNEDLTKISNKNSFLTKIRVTQVKYWPDSDFLRNRDKIHLKETENKEESIQQLKNNKANCFLRGLSEIYIEQEQLGKDFSVADNFFFQYYSPLYFYVKKGNLELREAIKKGLIESFKTGEFLCVYKHHFGKFIQKTKLRKTNRISLDNRESKKETDDSKYYLDFTKNYTEIFQNIEENRMTPSECKSLIELSDRNRQQRF
jgi:hypothetical protein